MISVIVVEDQPGKAAKVRELIEEVSEAPTIVFANSVHEAALEIKGSKFDLMILDVSLPMRSGEVPRRDGAENLLRQIQTRHALHVPTFIVGLTSFDDLEKEYQAHFNQFGWTLIHYDSASSDWHDRLTNLLVHVEKSHQVFRIQEHTTDLAIVTALEKPELSAVLELDGGWEKESFDNDDTFYHRGKFTKDGGELDVVAASAIQMGMPATVGLAMKICHHFRPRYLCMTGICAGVKGNFGDVIVANKSWDYGSGKSVATCNQDDGAQISFSAFEPAPSAIPLDAELIEKVKTFDRENVIGDICQEAWKGESPIPHQIGLQIGPMASGAAVLENRPLIDLIKSHDRKLVGVEMEAYGVFLTSLLCPAPRPKAFVVKSICDFGDKNKDDDWQDLAAFTSAQFLLAFAKNCL